MLPAQPSPARLRALRNAVVLALFAAPAAFAGAPPGRAWTPPMRSIQPDGVLFGQPTLLANGGLPVLLAQRWHPVTGSFEWAVVQWDDTDWRDSLSAPGTTLLGQRLTAQVDGPPTYLSIPNQYDVSGYRRLELRSLDGSIATRETVAVTTDQLSSFAYAGAATQDRRWVSRIEQRVNEDWVLRTYQSFQGGPWQSMPVIASGFGNCALAPIGDTSALLVWYANGAFWQTLEGEQWSPVQPFLRSVASAPTFVPHPEGGWRMTSSNWSQVQVDRWWNDQWTHEASLVAQREPPDRGFLYVDGIEPDRQGGPRPAIAWLEAWGDILWRTRVHVAWPLESGWSPGYQVPESDSVLIGPSVCRDVNGDAWVAWSLRTPYETEGAFFAPDLVIWTHTYTTATSTRPTLSFTHLGLRVHWELSESAPGTWWAVLRDEGDGTFSPVARVQAGAGTAMEWIDPSPPPPGALRYRIRRESVDAAYRWESEPASPVGVPMTIAPIEPLQLIAIENPSAADFAVQLLGAAAGTAEIQVFDIGGRRVASRTYEAAGPAELIRISFASPANGVYFVIARDAAGQTSPTLRLVRLAR